MQETSPSSSMEEPPTESEEIPEATGSNAKHSDAGAIGESKDETDETPVSEANPSALDAGADPRRDASTNTRPIGCAGCDAGDASPATDSMTTPCGADASDRDDDSTPDCIDECPDDALKTMAGGCGCGIPDADYDADGTLDCEDYCSLDPQKTAPGACGCGTVDVDGDGDGVADCIDPCPESAAATTCGCDSETLCSGLALNLALASVVAAADADSASKLPGTSSNSVRDGDVATYWSPDNIVPDGSAANEQRISVKWLDDPQTFDTVVLREDGNQVQAWRLETLEGQVLATGTTIGVGKLVQFAAVQSERANLFIVQASGLPRIAEIEVYDTSP